MGNQNFVPMRVIPLRYLDDEKKRNQFEKTKCVFPMFGGQEKFNCPTARKWIICALPDSFGYQISTCNSNLLLLTIAPSLVSRNNQMYLAGWVAEQCKTLCPAIFTPRRKQDTWHQNIAAPGRKLSNSREDRKGSMGLRELGCAQWGAWLGKPTQKSFYSFFAFITRNFTQINAQMAHFRKTRILLRIDISLKEQTHEKHILCRYCPTATTSIWFK